MKKKLKTNPIKIKELLFEKSKDLDFELISGREGLEREIVTPKVQRPGKILYAKPEYLSPGSILLLYRKELRYLEKLSIKKRKEVLDRVFSIDIVSIIVPKKSNIPKELVEACNFHNIALLSTSLSEDECYDKVCNLLAIELAQTVTIHGVLIDVYGVGILLLGGSGVGKSECALDLIVRGHRLISDDVIQIKKRADSIIIGSGPESIRYRMELRGLGLINIKDLFGVTSIRYKKRIELVILMELWDKDKEYDRLGIDDEDYKILGVKLPLIRMPVAPGRNLSILVEVAARNYLLKLKGYHTAKKFVEEHDRALRKEFNNSFPRLEEEDLE